MIPNSCFQFSSTLLVWSYRKQRPPLNFLRNSQSRLTHLNVRYLVAHSSRNTSGTAQTRRPTNQIFQEEVGLGEGLVAEAAACKCEVASSVPWCLYDPSATLTALPSVLQEILNHSIVGVKGPWPRECGPEEQGQLRRYFSKEIYSVLPQRTPVSGWSLQQH